ncbi:YslB family protein [Levilactobacillus cerevisiae]|uniref:YslB family protein n=1 Tax=Levilactobacillus cerevisiae TaxID=1704076 RepID=UPI00177B0435|nr:YslB family protein [Levilactobacillus cerevisiae]
MKNLYQTVMADANGAANFPQMLLREALLPELLGDDLGDISYWAGKSLARRFPIGNPKDATTFFEQAGFGTLALTKQTAQMTRWQLSGTPVKLRKQLQGDTDFTLEAGFLAEMMAQQLGVSAEAELTETPHKLQATTVTFDVYTDPDDVIPDYDAPTPLPIVRDESTETPEGDE